MTDKELEFYLSLGYGLVALDIYLCKMGDVSCLEEANAFINRGVVNFGINTGRESNLVAIEVYSKEMVTEWQQKRLFNNMHFPVSNVISTKGGGHLFFAYREGIKNLHTKNEFLPGVAIRADGAYAILPPAKHAWGNRYEWSNAGLGRIQLPPVPEYFVTGCL